MNISYDLATGEVKIAGIPVYKTGGLFAGKKSGTNRKFKARLTTVLAIAAQCRDQQFIILQDPAVMHLVYKEYQDTIQDFIDNNLTIADIELSTDDMLLMQMHFNQKLRDIYRDIKNIDKNGDEKKSDIADVSSILSALSTDSSSKSETKSEADKKEDDETTQQITNLFGSLFSGVTEILNNSRDKYKFEVIGPLTKDEIPKDIADKYSKLLNNYTYDDTQTQFVVKVKRDIHELAKEKIKEFLNSHQELKIYSYTIEFLDDIKEETEGKACRSDAEVDGEVKDQLDAMRDE